MKSCVCSCAGRATWLEPWIVSLNARRLRYSVGCNHCLCLFAHRLPVQSRPDAPLVVFTDCRREHDQGFSEHEQALVGAARRYLNRAIDAYYRVRRTFDGNEVIVMYVSGYDDGAQPLFGNYCVLLMREDRTIIWVFQSTHPHGELFKKTGNNHG